MVLSFNEIRAYFWIKCSAISQLSRRSKETIKGDKELGGILVTPGPSVLSTVIFCNILEISLPPRSLQLEIALAVDDYGLKARVRRPHKRERQSHFRPCLWSASKSIWEKTASYLFPLIVGYVNHHGLA